MKYQAIAANSKIYFGHDIPNMFVEGSNGPPRPQSQTEADLLKGKIDGLWFFGCFLCTRQWDPDDDCSALWGKEHGTEGDDGFEATFVSRTPQGLCVNGKKVVEDSTVKDMLRDKWWRLKGKYVFFSPFIVLEKSF